MRVAIVGAGVAGLANARVLLPLGFDVVLYEERPDIGGVWSATRGYPGLKIQNDKRSYAFSDFPMPAEYPAHPGRAQIRAYLAEYSRRHGIDGSVRLSTRVTNAEYDDGTAEWRITAEGPEGLVEDRADWLIIANGTLCTPNLPVLPGRDEFEAAGGRVVDADRLGDEVDFSGRHLALLGYGKSATDIAVAALGSAASITVLARSVPWKLPQRIGPIPFERIVISRLGEHLLWGSYRTVAGRVGKRIDTALRVSFRVALARRIRAQLGLDRRGLIPHGSIQNISHVITPGFDRAVERGEVDLRVGAHLARLAGGADGPVVELTDGTVLRADLFVAATGFRLDLSFLDERTRARLHDEDGEMPAYRHTLPARVPQLLFAGWINSFRSVIGDELQALWIGAFLCGAIPPASVGLARSRSFGSSPLGSAPSGLAIVDQDAWLHDLGIRLPWRVIAGELVRPIDPSAYAGLFDQLEARLRRAPGGGGGGAHAFPFRFGRASRELTR